MQNEPHLLYGAPNASRCSLASGLCASVGAGADMLEGSRDLSLAYELCALARVGVGEIELVGAPVGLSAAHASQDRAPPGGRRRP